MEKSGTSSLFANDGSFMEKFKQLQQQNQEKESPSRNSTRTPVNSKHAIVVNKKPLDAKVSSVKSSGALNLGGKLAFSLKQKSKLAVPAVNLSADEDEDEEEPGYSLSEGSAKRPKLGQSNTSVPPLGHGDVATPLPPSDPAVRKVADKLASFVAKNGRTFEDVTRQKNPGDTPFKFLFDPTCSDYKYYEYRLIQEEKALAQTKDSQVLRTSASASSSSKKSGGPQKNISSHNPSYNTPASALYGTAEETRSPTTSAGGNFGNGESSAPAADPIAMMEYYMKKAAHEERKRLPRHSKDEMPPPDSFEASVKKGHHMGDYIPQEELEKFLASCNDAAAQKAAQEAAEKAKIQADNVGHKLLSKMGWKEGEGLGSSKSGRADPVMAGSVKLNNLGVGAEQPGQVTPEDDIYEQYKKRMMLGYRYRPNPLNNPRKAYY